MEWKQDTLLTLVAEGESTTYKIRYSGRFAQLMYKLWDANRSAYVFKPFPVPVFNGGNAVDRAIDEAERDNHTIINNMAYGPWHRLFS